MYITNQQRSRAYTILLIAFVIFGLCMNLAYLSSLQASHTRRHAEEKFRMKRYPPFSETSSLNKTNNDATQNIPIHITNDANSTQARSNEVQANSNKADATKKMDEKTSILIPSSCSQDYMKTHLMEAEVTGRVGNQLFQLLMLIATAKSYCYTPLLWNFKDTLGAAFDLNYNNITSLNKTGKDWKMFDKTACKYNTDIEKLDTNYNWTFPGYYQSWKYFMKEETYVRSVVKFRKDILQTIKIFYQTNNIHYGLNICVHVRRGDFLSEYNTNLGYVVADNTYLKRAMDYYQNVHKGKRLNFIFASDDINWVKNNTIGKNRYFSPFSTQSDGACKDIALMSSCKHHIITGGSYGWMGAWLNGEVVVYYKGFPRPGTWLDREININEYYLPQWIGM